MEKTRGKWSCWGIVLLGCARLCTADEPALRMSWAEADHPSGVYHAKDEGHLSIVVDNATDHKWMMKGAIAFGMRVGADGFKASSVTPVTATPIRAGERAKIPLSVQFEGAGTYELRWMTGDDPAKATPLQNNDGITLECIFSPRLPTGAAGDPRWLAILPRQSVTAPGYLPDLAVQTAVRKYLLDERFAFDDATGISLGVGASLEISAERIDRLFTDASRAGVQFILRVAVPMHPGPRAVEAFRQYITDAVKRSHGSLGGLVISPEKGDVDRPAFREFYLAGAAAAKAGNKNIALLGAGTAAATRDLLLSDDAVPTKFLDAIAVTDTVIQPALAKIESKLPIWVLPPRMAEGWSTVPAAVALADGAAVVTVPPPTVDRGVVEHLLGGAAPYQQLQGKGGPLPYVASFQGDGYAVAAIAGLSAATPVDAVLPTLAATRTVVTPTTEDDKPPYPNLEVGDDSGTMRVVDAAGAAVDCRQGDTLYVPVTDKIVYVLQGGSAEDMMSILSSATTHRLPMLEITAKSADNAALVRLKNITDAPLAGTLRLTAAGANGPITIAETTFAPIASGKTLDANIDGGPTLPADGKIIAEIVTTGPAGATQRTVLDITSR